jgi:hypothetical protein
MKVRPAILMLILAVTFVLVLGTWGFQSLAPANDWLTSVYRAVQLFTMNSGAVDGLVPVPLEIARWLAPVATLGGVFAAASVMLRGFRSWVRLRFSRGHTIICGAGDKGATIAVDLLSSKPHKGTVVVIDINPDAPAMDDLRQRGAVVITGDACEAATLKKARLDRAARLVCAAAEDYTNLAIAMVAAKVIPLERADDPFLIYVHVADVANRDILQRNKALDLESQPQHRILVFNYFRNQARVILDACPLECDRDGHLASEVHLLIPELDQLAMAVILHSALIGHYRDGGKVNVHLASTTASKDPSRLLKSYPNFEKCAHLHVHPLDESSDFPKKCAEIISGLHAGAFATVFLASLAEHQALIEALILHERLPDNQRFRVLLDARDDSVVRDLLAEIPKDGCTPLSRWIHFIPSHRDACGGQAVFGESLDTVARKVHEAWYNDNAVAIRKAESGGDHAQAKKLRSKPAFRAWSELSEEQKDASRFAADHAKVKIRAAGLIPANFKDLRETWEQLDLEQLETLSRMEHERWCAPLWLSGWQCGSRDDARRTHNNLVPYDELDEATKDYDRSQVRKAAEYLQPHPNR